MNDSPGLHSVQSLGNCGGKRSELLDTGSARVQHDHPDTGARDVLLVLHAPVDGHQRAESGIAQALEERSVLEPLSALVRHGAHDVVRAGLLDQPGKLHRDLLVKQRAQRAPVLRRPVLTRPRPAPG